MKSVLYLGCPSGERSETEQLLADADVGVIWADTVAYALSQLQRGDMPVLLDLSRGAAALQTARELRSQRQSALIFAVVDARRPDLTTEAVLAGLADVFARPLSGKRVANAIDRELHYDSRQTGGLDAGRAHDLYAHSPAMRDVMALISRAATMRAGVLIRGEHGTGRTTVARTIHVAQEGAGPFVVVDCGGTGADELEVQLFGSSARVRADFPDGLERVSRRSFLHDALGGTLYLQNVTEAPSRVQARLARVLRDREVTIVDSRHTVDFDVRPIAGVDPSFEGAVAEGRMREDLVRRLSVIRIDVPPLRNRREDIPALANYFLRDVCASLRLPPKTMSRPALSLISALPWHGNAAELRTLIASVVTGLQGGRGIGLEDVLAHVRLDGGAVVFSGSGTLRQARARFEREYIARVLEQHHGRISDAAKTLGIQRTNLYRKMRTLRVRRSSRP